MSTLYVYARNGNETQVINPTAHSPEDKQERAARRPFAVLSRSHPLKHIAIIGCGGIGWWFAQFLAAACLPCGLVMHLFDDKELKLFHQDRMNVPTQYLGMNKAEALSRLLLEMHPTLGTAIPHAERLALPLTHVSSQVIIDTTDSAVFHTALYKECLRTEIQYYRISYNGAMHCTITDKSSSFCVGPQPTGYEVIRTWGVSAAAAAMLGFLSIWRRSAVNDYLLVESAYGGKMQVNDLLFNKSEGSVRYE